MYFTPYFFDKTEFSLWSGGGVVNPTDLSATCTSRTCFDIKFTANETDKIQTICKRNNNRKDKGDITMNLDKLINICILSVSGLPSGSRIHTGRFLRPFSLPIGILGDKLNHSAGYLIRSKLLFLIWKSIFDFKCQ